MPTIRLLPSTYYLSNTSYLKVTNESNMYTNVDSTNYATVANSRTQTTAYYIYLRGFNFDAIPDRATINSFTIKFKANQSGNSTSTSYRPYICNNTTTLTCSCNTISTSVTTYTFTGISASWDTIKGYGNNFGIRLTCTRSNRNTAANLYIYGAEILVDYSLPIEYTINSSGENCTVSPNGLTTVYDGSVFTLRIESDSKPTVTDNGVDMSDAVVQKQVSLDFDVSTAPNASYGFALNSNGYWESQNKGKASSAAVCVVSMDLPVECTVTFHLINYAESTYDYGLLSNIDTTLSNSASADSTNVYWNGSNKNSSNVQDAVYTIPSGQHFIYVKYFKDSYTDSNNDTLQFKIDITPNEELPSNVYYEYRIDAVHENHTIVAIVQTASGPVLYVVENGQLVAISKIYRVTNGVLVEVTDIEGTFNISSNYVRG